MLTIHTLHSRYISSTPILQIPYYFNILICCKSSIIMVSSGDATQLSPFLPSRKAASSARNSSDPFKAATNADAEHSSSQARQQRCSDEKSLSARSISGYPKAASISDGDQSFFRERTQRHSETGGSSVGSCSPISPLSTLTQSKARKVERQSLIRANAIWAPQPPPKAAASDPDLHPAASKALRKKFPETRPSPTPQASGSSNSPSSSTSPVIRVPSNATKDRQPPREAKAGHKWKHETSGHWLEIVTKRKRLPDERQAGYGAVTPGSRSTTSPLPLDHDQWHSGSATPPVHLLPSAGSILSESVTIFSQEGLYCRTKRRLGLKKDPINTTNVEPLAKTLTGEMLEEASYALREFAHKKKPQEETSSITTTNMSIAGSRSGLSRLLPSYRRTAHSTSSSVRNLMMGKAPETSPDPEAMYEGSDANTYFRTDIADPEGFTFLPSEARRVGTPPLSHAKRGFFFDYSNPPEDRNSSPESGAGSTPGVTPGGTSRKRRGSDFDWYKAKEDADDAKDKQAGFELNVPEHYPNSPLCPRNPKHKSGGKGMCVYHGRNN